MKKTIPILLALALVSGLASAQVKAVRVSPGPKIDGKLDEAAWQAAPAFTDFRMVEPTPGQDPTERTELRVVFDDDAIYIGIVCLDREPKRIAANTMAHDGGSSGGQMYGNYHRASSASNDQIQILLDPFQDKRTAYVFTVNPKGARGEGLVYAGSTSLNWDGIWDAEARIDSRGWSAEMRIPFKTLSFKPGLTTWGINLERAIARKQETIRLSGLTRDANFSNPNEAASLEGIENIRQGLGITFRPYALAARTKDHAAGTGAELSADAGFDVYKSITPNLVAVASYNMDFAETEVDERRINLTRFPMFFPEKRMFFLEGSENFSFSSSVSFTPFFSRTVGLLNGEQTPLTFGTKLYGKVGSTNISLIDVQTGAVGDLSSQNLLAARITQNIFDQSKVGLIFTNGSPTGERNSLAGLDFNYSSSKFLGNKNLMLAAWGVYNWNERTTGGHEGFGFRADFPNDLWSVRSTYAYYGKALDPGIGFLMRDSIQTAWAMFGFQPRPKDGLFGGWVRQFYFNASFDYYWDLEGVLETRTINLTPLSFRTESGEMIGFAINAVRDVLPYNFEVSDGIVIPMGAYDYTNFAASLSTAERRPVSAEATWRFGEFYSGHYDDVNLGLNVKVNGTVNLSLDANLVRGRMPDGNFKENVYQVKADIFLSPDLGWMNYIQYDDMSSALGWSSRLRWRISPGNELYFVFNKNWVQTWNPTSRYLAQQERSVIKVTLSVRP
jgi:hypothetical protein